MDLATAVDRLINQTAHWAEPRWAAAGRSGQVRALLQHLADLSADAEGRPRRPVPHLGDLVLPDQLRVLTDDLLGVGSPEQLDDAATQVQAVRSRL